MELLWKSWVPFLSSIGFWKTQQQNIPKPTPSWLEQNDNLPRKAHSEGFATHNHWKGDFSVFRSFPNPPNSLLCVSSSLLPLSMKMGLEGSPVWPKLAKPRWDVDQLGMQETPVPFLTCGSWSRPPHCSPWSHVGLVHWEPRGFSHKGLHFTA